MEKGGYPIKEKIPEIATLLLDAAHRRVSIPWSRVFAHFDGFESHYIDTEVRFGNAVGDTVTHASELLCDPKCAIYSSVIYKKRTRLPGDWFYTNIQIKRREYFPVLSNGANLDVYDPANHKVAMQIATAERLRVHEHAKQHYAPGTVFAASDL